MATEDHDYPCSQDWRASYAEGEGVNLRIPAYSFVRRQNECSICGRPLTDDGERLEGICRECDASLVETWDIYYEHDITQKY